MSAFGTVMVIFLVVTSIYHDIKGNDARAAKQLAWAILLMVAEGVWHG